MIITQNKISRKIVEKLRLREEKIISKKEIVQMLEEYQRIYQRKVNFNSIWTYLRKSKYIQRVLGEYYYIYSLKERYDHYCQYSEEELLFLILEKMKIKWYVGLEGALREHKVSWQALGVVPIVNTYFSGIKKVGSTAFKFIKTTEQKFHFGLLDRKTNSGVKYFYSNLEKTYLDFLYFHSYQGKDLQAIRKQLNFNIKKNLVKKYAPYYSQKIRKVL